MDHAQTGDDLMPDETTALPPAVFKAFVRDAVQHAASLGQLLGYLNDERWDRICGALGLAEEGAALVAPSIVGMTEVFVRLDAKVREGKVLP